MMYRIVRAGDGQDLGITDSPNYIKYGNSGCFTSATKKDAIGVAFQSTPYNLHGYDKISGAETVYVVPVDGGCYFAAANATFSKAVQDADRMNVDHEYRLLLLELGLN